MTIDINILETFEKDTRYNISNYLQSYNDFIKINRRRVFDYYNGDEKKPHRPSFDLLSDLLIESEKISDLIQIHKDKMTSGKYWELIDFIEDVRGSLWTIENSSKWLRSSIEKNDFNTNIEVERIIKQNETLEKISSDTGSVDPDNQWIAIALRNDLREEQYDSDGGNLIVSGYQNRATIKLKSVVDNIKGINIYGLDIDRKITFVDGDISVLSYRDTIYQTVKVLTELKQGQTPEFPQDGIQSDLVVGSNRASIAYPVLMRQFYNTFRKDDTLKTLTITKIDTFDDRIEIEFSVKTRLDEVVVVNSIL